MKPVSLAQSAVYHFSFPVKLSTEIHANFYNFEH